MSTKSFLFICFLTFTLAGWTQSDKQNFLAALSTNNKSEQKDAAEKLKGQYSSFTYAYYELMLSSLPKNTVLVTNAFDDTYPIAILQLTRSFRRDVKIISLKMLADSNYRRHTNELYKISLKFGAEWQYLRDIKRSLKKVCVSTTVSAKLWYSPSYYLVGLTVQTGSSGQLLQLVNFYNQYRKLKLKSYSFTGSDLAIISNILPPLITLYRLEPSKVLKEDVLELAALVKKAETVSKIIAKE